MKDKRVYITRESYQKTVDVWPATVGIRKFHSCISYGAAWNKTRSEVLLRQGKKKFAKQLCKGE